MAVKVLNEGLSTTVQDLGRPGYFHLGIPVGGAMDNLALRAANFSLATMRVPPALKLSSSVRSLSSPKMPSSR
jgi:allophanate hydrolase subunit 2